MSMPDPKETLQTVQAQAQILAELIRDQELYVVLEGQRFVLLEGWTLLASVLGLSVRTAWSRQMEGGWEARVEAVSQSGEVVAAGEALCARTERNWAKAPEFALRSMAQTRAAAKALRLAYGYLMRLAGYEATPAEEVIEVQREGAMQNSQQNEEPHVFDEEGVCPQHGEALVSRPGGISKRTGKRYPPYRACPVQGCKHVVWGSFEEEGGES